MKKIESFSEYQSEYQKSIDKPILLIGFQNGIKYLNGNFKHQKLNGLLEESSILLKIV